MTIKRFRPFSSKSPAFGISSHWPSETVAKQIGILGARLCATDNLLWYKCQDVPNGVVHTVEYDDVFSRLLEYRIEPIVQIFGTPYWATKEEFPFSVVANVDYFVDFMDQFVVQHKPYRYYQIYNEVDVEPGERNYFGGWGPVYIQRYIDCLKEISYLRSAKRKFAVSLMFNEDTRSWAEAFVRLGGCKYVDHVYIHYYAYWYYGYDHEAACVYRDDLKSVVRDAHALFDRPIFLTETNLLKKGESTPEFEQHKKDWIQMAVPAALGAGAKKVLVYAYPSSGWQNADIAGLPAEEVVKRMCEHYKW